MKTLYLIATLIGGTTSFQVSQSSRTLWKSEYREQSVYNFAAIETWYCKYYPHRWVENPPTPKRDYVTLELRLPGSEEVKMLPGQHCSICDVQRKKIYVPVTETRMTEKWEE